MTQPASLFYGGDTGPACNVVGMIYRNLLGIHHLYRRPIYARMPECSIISPDYGPLPPDAPSWCQAPFEPEGLLSSVMAIVTCLVGSHYGHIILHFKDHRIRIILDDSNLFSCSFWFCLGYIWNACKQSAPLIQLYWAHCWCCWHSLYGNILDGCLWYALS